METRRPVNSIVMFLFYPRKIAATIFFLIAVVVVAQSQKRGVTQSEAVALAEQFIAQNGYTDLPPNKKKLSYESIEWESNIEEMLRLRHDTLERRAYGFVHGRKGGEPGWTIVFRYTPQVGDAERTLGRAVTMNLNGTKLRVEHVDFVLRYATKL